jgi:hypothetical protein
VKHEYVLVTKVRFKSDVEQDIEKLAIQVEQALSLDHPPKRYGNGNGTMKVIVWRGDAGNV